VQISSIPIGSLTQSSGGPEAVADLEQAAHYMVTHRLRPA